MRGELNIRNEYRNGLNRGGLDITAPSTPGTASSMRTNPPSYQRMHSNDSSKGNDAKDGTSNGRISDWLDHPSTVHAPGKGGAKKYLSVSNNFRRASNPALNKHQVTAPPRIARLQRNPPSSRSRHLIGNSVLPPLPPNINARSHSLDGLLDSSERVKWSQMSMNQSALAAEGLNKSNNSEKKPLIESRNQSDSKDSIKSTTNRRSKSLDDLLDDDNLLIVEDERETQSMENILEKADPKLASNESITISASPDVEKMCESEILLVDSSMPMSDECEVENDDSGIHSMDANKLNSEAGSFDDDTISNTISLTSSTASADKKSSGKTFLNKYMKKVKSLIKKWTENALYEAFSKYFCDF